jgi:hypothetical protein
MSEAMRKKRAEQNWPAGRMRGVKRKRGPLTPTLSPAVETIRVGTIASGGDGVALFHMDDHNPGFALQYDLEAVSRSSQDDHVDRDSCGFGEREKLTLVPDDVTIAIATTPARAGRARYPRITAADRSTGRPPAEEGSGFSNRSAISAQDLSVSSDGGSVTDRLWFRTTRLAARASVPAP